MNSWAATQAKAKFSEVLDKAETQGPQRIERRKRRFVLLTEEQYAEHAKTAPKEQKPIVSAWDALKPSFDERYEDLNFPRTKSKARWVRFE